MYQNNNHNKNTHVNQNVQHEDSATSIYSPSKDAYSFVKGGEQGLYKSDPYVATRREDT